MTADISAEAGQVVRRGSRLPVTRPVAVIAIAWLTLVVVASAAAPLLSPAGPLAQDTSAALQGPTSAHILGTDQLGRDILARLLWGARSTLLSVAVSVLVAVGLGAPAGLAGGYVGGLLDRFLSVVADILMAVPLILVLLVAFAIFPNNVYLVMAVFGLFTTSALYRIVRGATLTIAGELYIAAARSAGLTDVQIIRRHLAPRLGGLIRVQASVVAAIALVTEVGLGFLSLDVAPPAPSWGGLLLDASQNLANDPWMLVPTVAAVCLTVLAFGVLGDVAAGPRGRRRDRLAAPAERSEVAERARSSAPATAAPSLRGGSLLVVRDLTVETSGEDPLTLVEHVTFDIHRGEVVGLVGESGAGKSVTARALTRLDPATTTTGSVVFDGTELLTLSEGALHAVRGKRIAFIGQDPMSSLDPLYRIDSQLAEAVRTHHRGVSRRAARQRAVDLLAAVHIPDPAAVARKRPFEISGGMAQRVAIALALAGDPDLLIADEPTTALDVTVQMDVLGLLKSLQRDRGLSIVLVTHDWGVVADMCDRAITMYAGEVVETGDVDDVFAAPSHPYTAALRQSDPHHQAIGAQLLSIRGTVPAPRERPSHCRFADRCPLVTNQCRTVHPQLVELPGEGRGSRCLRTEELREETARA